jgi:hypothetical protein
MKNTGCSDRFRLVNAAWTTSRQKRDTPHPHQVCVRARKPVCAMQHLAAHNGSLSCRPISRQVQPPPALPEHRGSSADADGSNTGFLVCGISSVTFRVPLQRRHDSGILRLEPMSDDRTRAAPPKKLTLVPVEGLE